MKLDSRLSQYESIMCLHRQHFIVLDERPDQYTEALSILFSSLIDWWLHL